MGDGTTGTLRLTIGSPSPATTVEDSIALGGTYLFGCQRIPATAVGTATYTDALTNTSGCDSLVTLSLRVYRPFVPRDTTVYWTDSIALGGTYLFGCQRITPTVLGSSDYTDILSPWLGGGDSTSVLTLRTYKAAPVVEPEVLDTICEGTTYTWNRNGKDYTAAGLYHDTLVGAVRDTAVSLHLTINPVRRTNIDTTVCEGTSVRMWGHDYVVGTYTQTLSSTVTGCDSVITLNVHEQSCEPLRDTITDAVCGGSYLFGCRTLTESGTYSDTLSSMVSVLDSIVTLQLTIHTVQDTTIRDTICAGDSLLFFGKYYHTAGDYRDTTKSIITGCDSIGTLRLRVNQPTTGDTTATICRGDLPYEWHGQILNAAGTATYTTTNVADCDSVVTLTLVVNEPTTGDTTATICRGDLPYEWHGQILNTKGSATYTLTNAAGCDSVVTLTLTVQEPTMAAEETVSVCESALPYNWLDHYEVNTAGIHRDTVYYTTGCDSVYYTLHLIVNQPTTGDTTATICRDELPYEWYGQTLNDAGTLTRVITNAAGCDSTITLTLVVNEPTAGDTTATICRGELPYEWYGQTLNDAGKLTRVITNAAGCDSTITLTLVVNEPTAGDTTATICRGELPYEWYGQTLTQAGTTTHTLTNAAGCDSVVTLTLTVQEPTMAAEETVSVCESELPYNWLDHYEVNIAGFHRDTAYYTTGCDSVYYTLHLIVNKPSTGDTTATICRDELPYEWYGQTLNDAGTLTRVITNAAGCDSTITLTLVVNEPTAGDTTAAICVADLPYIWYGQTLTQAGTTTHTLTNAAGCDSVVTLTLIVNEPMTIDTTVTICEGRKYLLGTTELTESGSYTYTTASLITGCDSTTNLTLVVTPAEVDYISETICEGDTYDLHGTLLSTAGTYRDTTYAADGCMSITELTLSTRTCLARAEVSVTGFVCPGTEYRGRLTSHIIMEAVSWTDSVHVNVDGVPTDSLYDYSITPYVTTLPTVSADDMQAICGQAIMLDEAIAKVNAHIAAESHYAPNHIIAWEVQTNGTWQPLNITTAIRGGVEQLTIRLTVITDCGVETSAPLTVKVETPAPENTASMDNVPAVSKYSDYLLMIDKREIETTFDWTLQPADVRWYRVVGTIDNYADGSTRDDEQVGEGFYYTVGAQLAGSFYARITHEPTTATECSGELRTVELICSASKAAPQLAPNVARPAEQIRVLNLNPECTTEIRVYSVNGELLETYTSQEAVEFFLRAAGTAGYYMVDVQTDDEKVTLQYIVK